MYSTPVVALILVWSEAFVHVGKMSSESLVHVLLCASLVFVPGHPAGLSLIFAACRPCLMQPPRLVTIQLEPHPHCRPSLGIALKFSFE